MRFIDNISEVTYFSGEMPVTVQSNNVRTILNQPRIIPHCSDRCDRRCDFDRCGRNDRCDCDRRCDSDRYGQRRSDKSSCGWCVCDIFRRDDRDERDCRRDFDRSGRNDRYDCDNRRCDSDRCGQRRNDKSSCGCCICDIFRRDDRDEHDCRRDFDRCGRNDRNDCDRRCDWNGCGEKRKDKSSCGCCICFCCGNSGNNRF